MHPSWQDLSRQPINHRILFICTQMEAGGVQRRATSMAAAFNDLGIPSKVLFLYKKRPAYEDLPFCIPLLGHRPRNIFDFLKIFRSLFAETKGFVPTAVVGMAHYSSPIAASLAWLLGIPNRIATQTNPPSAAPRMARILDMACGLLGMYTANICASKSIESHFGGYPSAYRRSLTTVLNGISQRVSRPISKTEARQRFGLPEDSRIIINCGRLSPQKNQILLVRCMENIDAKLVIAGDGELRREIEAEISKRSLEGKVIMLGEVSPTMMDDFLLAGDIFAFPSKHEAFGLAAVEAMRAGLPVVASNHEALVEVIGNAAILLDPASEADWSTTLSSLLEDDDQRADLSRRSIECSARYSFENMLSGFYRYATAKCS